jgi:hypothetical protein
MQTLTEDHNAPFLLVYGDTNSGKTTSIIRTAPQPIYCISAEGDALKSVAVCKEKGEDIDITVVMPDSHEDLMDTLNRMLLKVLERRAQGKPFKYNTVLMDSGTYWMNCKLAIRVEDDRNKDRQGVDEGKLSAMTKTDWTEVNTVNSQMARLTDLLKSLANAGVMVVMTAQMQNDPKWNNELEAAPCFNYKDYNKALKGYFDYIGYTMPNIDEETGKVKYPPKLSFSGSQGYLVKWRGVQPQYLITNFRLNKIFKWFVDSIGKEEVKKAPDAEPEEIVEAEVRKMEDGIENAAKAESPDDYDY